MGRIADWVNARPASIRKIVDQTQERVRRRSGLTDEYFPVNFGYDDFDLLWLKFTDEMPIASVIGFEGEVPHTKSGKVTELEMEVFKLGLAYLWKENDFKLMHKYENRLQGVPQSFKNRLFGSVQMLVPRITDLASVLLWEVIYKGNCSYTDPRTGLKAELTYSTESSLFPSALTTTNRWTEAATANGLQNLVDLSEAFYAIHGYFPDVTVMSRTAYNNLRNQASTKEAAVAKTGSAATAANTVVSPELLNALFADREIPPIYVNQNGQTGFDDEVDVEDAAGNISRRRLLPTNYVTFLTKKQRMGDEVGNDAGTMGERAFGPTVENDMNPGIYTLTEEVSKSPPVDRALAVGTFVPAIWDSRLLCARKIAS